MDASKHRLLDRLDTTFPALKIRDRLVALAIERRLSVDDLVQRALGRAPPTLYPEGVLDGAVEVLSTDELAAVRKLEAHWAPPPARPDPLPAAMPSTPPTPEQ